MAKLKSGSHQFAIKYGKELTQFFYEAQMKYASGEISPEDSGDGGFLIFYQRGDWRYSDLWYGGEPFAGLTRIYYKGEICFCMTYSGRIMPYADQDSVMACLMESLRNATPRQPWRGPNQFIVANGMIYENQHNSRSDNNPRFFTGKEVITKKCHDDTMVTLFTSEYTGRIVNQDGKEFL